MNNYEYIKYKNLFCCHALKIEEITDKNMMFLCYYRDLKKDLYNGNKIDSKEFCEHFNEIIEYYFKPFCTFQISEEKVNKYIDKCYASVAALFKFIELYIKNENKNLDVA